MKALGRTDWLEVLAPPLHGVAHADAAQQAGCDKAARPGSSTTVVVIGHVRAYQPVDVVEVLCWGSRVGAIALDPGSGFYVFEYARPLLNSGVELAPTTMPVAGGSRPSLFPALPVETYYRLPAMVADSLPDDFGNALTTAYLADQGVRPDQITLSTDSRTSGRGGSGRWSFALSGDHVLAARPRSSCQISSSRRELQSRVTSALKLHGVGADRDLGGSGNFGRIEYGYHLMATAAGIDMTECRHLEEGGRAHFMTRRFDRTPTGEKVHTQTLCAMAQLDFRLIGAHDYAQMFLHLDNLTLGEDTRAEAFRRMVFNVVAANCDDHTKNFSFLLPKGGDSRLAPAYGVTHAHAPDSRWTRRHVMAVNGRSTAITRADLAEVGDRFGVPAVNALGPGDPPRPGLSYTLSVPRRGAREAESDSLLMTTGCS